MGGGKAPFTRRQHAHKERRQRGDFLFIYFLYIFKLWPPTHAPCTSSSLFSLCLCLTLSANNVIIYALFHLFAVCWRCPVNIFGVAAVVVRRGASSSRSPNEIKVENQKRKLRRTQRPQRCRRRCRCRRHCRWRVSRQRARVRAGKMSTTNWQRGRNEADNNVDVDCVYGGDDDDDDALACAAANGARQRRRRRLSSCVATCRQCFGLAHEESQVSVREKEWERAHIASREALRFSLMRHSGTR